MCTKVCSVAPSSTPTASAFLRSVAYFSGVILLIVSFSALVLASPGTRCAPGTQTCYLCKVMGCNQANIRSRLHDVPAAKASQAHNSVDAHYQQASPSLYSSN